jgi:hypothetical protein
VRKIGVPAALSWRSARIVDGATPEQVINAGLVRIPSIPKSYIAEKNRCWTKEIERCRIYAGDRTRRYRLRAQPPS